MKHLNAISESFDLELKRWLDPKNEREAAIIAKACIALRNNNGGKLIFGFDDKSTEQDRLNYPSNVQSRYHSDAIQQIIGQYSLPPFPVEVLFEDKNGMSHPIVLVPAGIQAPTITRRGFEKEIKQNAVYVRCLANNTVSSCEPTTAQDWDRLIKICFENREADIGKFFRRHLPQISQGLKNLSANSEAEQIINTARSLFEEKWSQMKGLQLAPTTADGFREVAFWIDGEFDKLSSVEFKGRVFSQQPHYTEWPCWINSSNFSEEEFRPYPYKGGWQAFVLNSHFKEDEIDFWRIEPSGCFYHLRTHEDDTSLNIRGKRNFPRKSLLDFVLIIARAAEHIATAKAFAESVHSDIDKAVIRFRFRWSGLKGRSLSSWVEPQRLIFQKSLAHDDDVSSEIQFPLVTSIANIWMFVKIAVQPLWDVFGASVPDSVIEEIVNSVMQRKR